ncbi:hypothetical protein [Macrococcoides caseolyticum]|uniref:hypothetical protein n=1 Tax=Macrococcoides caseolyticum TaxID=69966 RepID=UPI000C32F70C|nr:hypothetical protein [Macrococcus caseolyticus]PKE34900.1 hypothetical protein CW695_11190 [Macrococcus caseolyticus]PKE48242.1 hypothetical protein CW672_10860 [Macrococcus caseolyticus]PKE62220.1 hypothetical protein CW683_11570 [Macrococcus caseolyticus]QYA77709.1 hypothetical protein KYI12_12370 [Macrococcus caseolyticus]
MTNIDYEKEIQALEEKKKQLLKEKREKDKKELQTLKEVFGKDFPRKENGKFISLDEFKKNYVISHKDQSGIDPNKLNEVQEELNQLKKALNGIADAMDDSRGYWHVSDLKGLTNWLSQFRTKG